MTPTKTPASDNPDGKPAEGAAKSSRIAYRAFKARFRAGTIDPKKAADETRSAQLKAGSAAADSPPSAEKASFWALFRRLLPYYRPYRARIAAALALQTVGAALALVPPAATKFAIDYVLSDKPGPSGLPPILPWPSAREDLLIGLAVVVSAVAMLSMVISTVDRYLITTVQKRVGAQMRHRTFHHVMQLPLHRLIRIKSGGVSSLLRSDAGAAGDLVFALIYTPFRSLVRLLGTLVILAYIDITLLLLALVLIPFIALTHRTWIARIRPLWRDMRKNRTEIDAAATEAVAGIRVVRTFGRERQQSQRFTTGNHLLVRKELFTWWWSRAVQIVWSVLVPGASAGVLLYGGMQILDGTLTLGDVMMFSTYLLMLLGPLEALVQAASGAQTGLAGAERALDVLDMAPESSQFSGQAPIDANRVKGAFRFTDVDFTYPETERPALQDISFSVAPGETVALVGPSGAGKTTLTHLLSRFYAPQKGRIELDGRDVANLSLTDYRSLFSIVEQDVFLFDGTVRENIAFALRGADEASIEAAARAAFAHEFITELNHGYDTMLGERGVRLSGGQRQRIALARALLRDAPVLILDEATSNLDAESEAHIKTSLKSALKGRTAFIIAHRLSTVRDADRVLVLDGGRIVEAGTHDTLLARGGRYADLLRAQLEPALGEAPAA